MNTKGKTEDCLSPSHPQSYPSVNGFNLLAFQNLLFYSTKSRLFFFWRKNKKPSFLGFSTSGGIQTQEWGGFGKEQESLIPWEGPNPEEKVSVLKGSRSPIQPTY